MSDRSQTTPSSEASTFMDVIRRRVQELAERGETRTRGLTRSAQEMAARSQRSRDELMRLVRKEIARQRQARGRGSEDR